MTPTNPYKARLQKQGIVILDESGNVVSPASNAALLALGPSTTITAGTKTTSSTDAEFMAESETGPCNFIQIFPPSDVNGLGTNTKRVLIGVGNTLVRALLPQWIEGIIFMCKYPNLVKIKTEVAGEGVWYEIHR